MKCPYCKIGDLQFFGDACATYSIPDQENEKGELEVENPYLQTVYDEERGITCTNCPRSVTSDYNHDDPEHLLEPILEKIEVLQDSGFVIPRKEVWELHKKTTEESC